jgi:hypothetical protein
MQQKIQDAAMPSWTECKLKLPQAAEQKLHALRSELSTSTAHLRGMFGS